VRIVVSRVEGETADTHTTSQCTRATQSDDRRLMIRMKDDDVASLDLDDHGGSSKALTEERERLQVAVESLLKIVEKSRRRDAPNKLPRYIPAPVTSS
jgi:hypothetical protein